MAEDRLGRILAALSAAGADSWSSVGLCGVCPYIVGVDGAGVMLMSGDIPRGSLCTTNAVSHLIEELQYTLGEGPCVDAYQQNQVVAEPDLAEPVASRWLAFTPPALAAGVRAIFGYPLRVGSVRLGALNLYRRSASPLTGPAPQKWRQFSQQMNRGVPFSRSQPLFDLSLVPCFREFVCPRKESQWLQQTPEC